MEGRAGQSSERHLQGVEERQMVRKQVEGSIS